MDDRLEIRYLVFKLSKLTPVQERLLNDVLNANTETVGCVVVEEDWPMYSQVVDLVLGEAEK